MTHEYDRLLPLLLPPTLNMKMHTMFTIFRFSSTTQKKIFEDMMITFLLSILILNLLEVNGQDVFKVSSTLGSHMVLQRDSEDVVVWGFAKSDSNVTTTFDSKTYVSVTDATGMYFLKNSHSHLYSIDLTFILLSIFIFTHFTNLHAHYQAIMHTLT